SLGPESHAAAVAAVRSAGGGEANTSLRVWSVTLDDLLSDAPEEFSLEHHTCAFLKVDAEGDDPDVLRGASGLLRNPKLLGAIVEEHRELLELKNHGAQGVAE
ncbi:ANKRD17, partial [Symbiodinium sp. CCMP2456]